MADTFADVPDREWFKASEVCELADVQLYVLRSWELEFPGLGVSKSAGGPRFYRRADVERVRRIRHLVFVEGLTLAGVRRTLGEEPDPGVAGEPNFLDGPARTSLGAIKQELRALHELLSGRPAASAPRAEAAAQGSLPEFTGEAAGPWPPKRPARRRGGRKA